MSKVFKYNLTTKRKELGDVNVTEIDNFSDEVLNVAKIEIPLVSVVIDNNINTNNINPPIYDGVTLSANNRVLLVNQLDQKQNGVWIVNPLATAQLIRPTDTFSRSFMLIAVGRGTKYSNSIWQQGFNSVVGTDNLTFTQLTSKNTSKSFFKLKAEQQSIGLGTNNIADLNITIPNGDTYSFKGTFYVRGNFNPHTTFTIAPIYGKGKLTIAGSSSFEILLSANDGTIAYTGVAPYNIGFMQHFTFEVSGYYTNNTGSDLNFNIIANSSQPAGATVLAGSYIKYKREF